MFLCIFVLFCANKSILSTPEGHGIQEVSGLFLLIPVIKAPILTRKSALSNYWIVSSSDGTNVWKLYERVLPAKRW